ncbi:MAG: hypothetical protein AAB389_03555 [Patescibacteria group bacterium]
MASSRLKIVNGPSKFDVMMALFAKNSDSATVDFEVQEFVAGAIEIGTFRKVIISALERESGNGESWMFQGWDCNEGPHKATKVEGFFCTRTRTGWMKIV